MPKHRRPKRLQDWREQLPFTVAEFADKASPDHSRQVKRQLLRRLAKAELAAQVPENQRQYKKQHIDAKAEMDRRREEIDKVEAAAKNKPLIFFAEKKPHT
jgi:trans-aconitate methyltransferase